ncbi:MAG: hypothetical protein FJW22_17570 [Acidimicrobiia bacterium]|nr:hypothetical protein [Acidimicrobiia bacterium]
MGVTRRALIVGAGIGGLSAGIALRRIGWHIRLFERAASPRELGFGLALAPNAVAALGELGVADAVLARSFVPTNLWGEIRRPDGRVLKQVDLPARDALGGPMAVALRPALHGALLDAVGDDVITTDSEASGFEVRNGGVALRLTSGAVAEGDVLIGADGIGSTIRCQLHASESPPRASGLVAIRGAVDGALQHLGPLSAVYYMGAGIESAIVRASETSIYWFLSLARGLVPDGLEDAAAIVAHMATQFDDTFRAITSATTDLRYDALADRDPLHSWGRGPITLLGDAAHPLLPHTGQGAAQALVDAVALGKMLSSALPVEAALRSYERERQRKTRALLYQGRRMAALMRTRSPVACYLRDVAVRLAPVTSIAKVLVHVNRRAGTAVDHGRDQG